MWASEYFYLRFVFSGRVVLSVCRSAFDSTTGDQVQTRHLVAMSWHTIKVIYYCDQVQNRHLVGMSRHTTKVTVMISICSY